MPPFNLTPALVSTAGFAFALAADFALGLPVALEFPTLGVRAGCVVLLRVHSASVCSTPRRSPGGALSLAEVLWEMGHSDLPNQRVLPAVFAPLLCLR